MKKILIVIVVLMAVVQSSAQNGGRTIDNVFYIPSYGGTVTVGKSEQAAGNVVIPETVKMNGKDLKVTAIAENAFRDNDNIKSVTLPKTIQKIGKGAFWRCRNLTKTNIPDNVVEVGSQAYQQTGLAAEPNGLLYIDNWLVGYGYVDDSASGGKKIKKPEGNVVIKEGTRGIAKGCFDFCSRMTSVTIPATVDNIFFPLFKYCNELTTIVVDKDNKYFDSRSNCNAVISKNTNSLLAGCRGTVIPESVEMIASSAFEGCEMLSSITIPAGVKRIHSHAFKGCVNLMQFSIPETVTSISKEAFVGTGWYKAQPDGLLYKDGWLLGYKGAKPSGKMEVRMGTKHIASNAFERCDEIKELTLPEGLTEIAFAAFQLSTKLTTVIIPQSMNIIGQGAFYACSSLKKAEIPDGVTVIGPGAFEYCTSLKSVHIPEGVTYVHPSSFKMTAWYEKQSDGALYLDGWMLGWKGKNPTGKVVVKDGTKHLAEQAFNRCEDLKEVILPTTIKTIGSSAFAYCTSLESAVIPEGVETIPSLLFRNCKKLTNIHIPESVTAILSNPFYNTGWMDAQPKDEMVYLDHWLLRGSKEREQTVMPGTKGIASYAFNYNKDITLITLPSSLKYVGNGAFGGCTGLAEVNISDLDAWKRIKFEDETANPTYYSKSLTVNGQTITEW